MPSQSHWFHRTKHAVYIDVFKFHALPINNNDILFCYNAVMVMTLIPLLLRLYDFSEILRSIIETSDRVFKYSNFF